MKGRQTSYQRFSSLLGTTGSVVNKFFRSLEGLPNGRDSELMGKVQRDKSDNKGIYNKTLKIEDDLTYDYEKEDLGEEVYGCISRPFGKSSINIEKDSETAIEGRKTKREDSPHFDVKKRKWYHQKTKRTHEDCALIPQENLPLVVNSKFQMKYWENKTNKTTDILKATGFTSGSLVRPISFIKEAERIENGYGTPYLLDSPIQGRAHILQGVPLEIAHQLINCCKEIELKGEVSYSIRRTTSKRCKNWNGNDGPESTEKVWEGEDRVGCPPVGSCINIGGSQSAGCRSSALATTIKLDGKLEMTAYRHKQVADIWEKEPKVLDISGNFFWGSLEKAALRKTSSSGCNELDLGSTIVSTKLPDPTIKQVLEFEKQTKLSSGCLSYPLTNNSIIIAKEENNLKPTKLVGYTDICEPDTAVTNHNLTGPSSLLGVYEYPSSYPSGINMRTKYNSDTAVRPLYVSGPSLYCNFNGIGWDYSEIGKKEPEAPWHPDDCGEYPSNYKDWKMTWISTNLKKTFEGDCAHGFGGFDRYARKKNNCVCGDDCADCKSDWGKLKLLCECEPQCSDGASGDWTLENPNPCAGPYMSECDGTYGLSLNIGKYVGVQNKDPYKESDQIYNVAPVPLTAKAQPATKEDLVLWLSGFISDAMPGVYFPNYHPGMQLAIYPNRESVDIALAGLQETSLIRYEKKSAGSVTLSLDDWTNSFPIWVILPITKETSCKTYPSSGGSVNMQFTEKEGAPYNTCVDCDFFSDKPACCTDAGCGGVATSDKCCNDKECGIDDPCAQAIYVTPPKEKCADNTKITCSGTCVAIDTDCGCCDCVFCGFDDDGEPEEYDCTNCCEAWTTNCKPYKVTKEFENLSCYGDGHDEDVHEVSINLTIEFKPFKEKE